MEIAWNKLIAVLGMVAFIVIIVVVGRSMSKKKPPAGEKPGEKPAAPPQ
jgi:hypothetical protein